MNVRFRLGDYNRQLLRSLPFYNFSILLVNAELVVKLQKNMDKI